MYQMKNVLVTGGAGFIGSHYIHYVLTNLPRVNVFNLDKLTYAGSLENLKNIAAHPHYQFIHGDVCDRELIDRILRQYAIDTIVHFAAESHVDRSIKHPEQFIKTNVLGTFNLLDAARHFWLDEKHYSDRQCRFHHVSTDEVFGSLSLEGIPFSERSPYVPNSPYSASKASSDHLVRTYFVTYGLPMTLSNCSNNFGPYQHPEKFIPTIIRGCLQEQLIPIYGAGKNIRDWLYVEDHCKLLHAIICFGQVGESYNIGGENELDNLTLAKKICFLMDALRPRSQSYSDLLNFVEDRPGHDFRYAIDGSKLKQSGLSFPLTDFTEALQKTIAFYSASCSD